MASKILNSEKSTYKSDFPLKFILYFLLSAVIIIVIGYFYYLTQKNKIENEYYNYISTLKDFKLQQIESEQEVRKKLLDSFINIPQKLRSKNFLKESLLLDEIKKNIQDHQTDLKEDFGFQSLTVFNKKFEHHYTSSTEKNLLDVFLYEEISAILRNVAPGVHNIYINKDKKLVQSIILPVLQVDETVGYIWAEVSFFDYLYPVINYSNESPRSSEFLLVKKQSDLAFLLRDIYDEEKSTVINIPIRSEDKLEVQNLLKGEEFIRDGKFKGKKIIGSVKQIRGTEWSLIAVFDQEIVLKSIRQTANVTLLFVLILILLAIAVTYAVWYRTRIHLLVQNVKLEREKAVLSERYMSLTKYANDIILSLSSDGKILESNKKAVELYGYSSEELRGKSIKDLSIDAVADEKLSEINPENDGMIYESFHKASDGTVFPVQISARRIQKHSEDIILAIIRDFSERKRLENELVLAKDKAEEMNRLKTYFLANMSHELRTPINGIMGYSEILMLELEKDKHAEMIEMGQQIYQSSARLNSTLNSLFDLARLESSEMKLKSEKLDLNQIIKIAANIFKTQILQKSLELKFDFKNSSLQINSDENILLKILRNLLDNSVKYTTSGSITIKTIVEEDYAKIMIIDTGIGISKEKINIIFEPFRQGSEGLNRDYEGSGIGLSITKRFIELLGGTISIESELGNGTKVVLVLPREKNS